MAALQLLFATKTMPNVRRGLTSACIFVKTLRLNQSSCNQVVTAGSMRSNGDSAYVEHILETDSQQNSRSGPSSLLYMQDVKPFSSVAEGAKFAVPLPQT